MRRRPKSLGFDLVFGLAQWLGKGGYGGEMHFREHEVDPIIANAALTSLTRSIVLINTVHVLYAWHPLHLAKFGAAMDHISGGRWGINVVTGYKPSEYRMFGLEPIEHDLRYVMADEFTTIMERLWSEDEELTFAGQFWKTERAFLAPKPGQRRPFLVERCVVRRRPRLCGEAFRPDLHHQSRWRRSGRGLQSAARPQREDQGPRRRNTDARSRRSSTLT